MGIVNDLLAAINVLRRRIEALEALDYSVDAQNAGTVDGFHANATATASNLLPLDAGGDLQLGGGDVVTSGTVDGVDVSAHHGRHDAGGADALTLVPTHDHTGDAGDGATLGEAALNDGIITSRKWKPTISRVARTATFDLGATVGSWVDVTSMSINITPLVASIAIISLSATVKHPTNGKVMWVGVDVDGAQLDPGPDFWFEHYADEPGNVAWTYYTTLSAAAHTIKLQAQQNAIDGDVAKCELIVLLAAS